MITFSPNRNPWIVDSGASHHVTSQLSNLSLYQSYEGHDDIVIDDGSDLQISHIGFMSLSLSLFTLNNVLRVPSIH